jgi:menaquinol-cytochrome c reductase iron-sulfur subunit
VHPGSPQSAMTRQAMFATGATVGLGALMSAIIAVPVTVAVLAPSFKTIKEYNVDIGPTSLYPKAGGGQIPWHAVTFENKPDDTTGLSRRLVYVRNDGNDKFTAIANTCMHLGCPVQANATGFACPCHGGQYDTRGVRTAGPPIRPLDRFQWEIQKDILVITQRWSVDYVNGQLTYFPVKMPGQPVHTPGPFGDTTPNVLYPNVTYTHGPVPKPQ